MTIYFIVPNRFNQDKIIDDLFFSSDSVQIKDCSISNHENLFIYPKGENPTEGELVVIRKYRGISRDYISSSNFERLYKRSLIQKNLDDRDYLIKYQSSFSSRAEALEEQAADSLLEKFKQHWSQGYPIPSDGITINDGKIELKMPCHPNAPNIRINCSYDRLICIYNMHLDEAITHYLDSFADSHAQTYSFLGNPPAYFDSESINNTFNQNQKKYFFYLQIIKDFRDNHPNLATPANSALTDNINKLCQDYSSFEQNISLIELRAKQPISLEQKRALNNTIFYPSNNIAEAILADINNLKTLLISQVEQAIRQLCNARNEFNQFFERTHLVISESNLDFLKRLTVHKSTLSQADRITNSDDLNLLQQDLDRLSNLQLSTMSMISEMHAVEQNISSLGKTIMPGNNESQVAVVEFKSLDCYESIIKQMIAPDWQELPLINAINSNNKELWISDIKNSNTSLVDKDSFENTPLHVAILVDNIEFVESICRKGHVDNDANKFGFTPLHIAVIKGDVESVKILLTHHIDPLTSCEIIHPISEKPVAVNALILAVLLGQVDVVKAMIKTLKNQNSLDKEQLAKNKQLGNILHVGIVSLYANILESLLTDPVLKDWVKEQKFITDLHEGKTPLAYAAELGNPAAIEWLVKADADIINAQNNFNNRTPLHYAVMGYQPLTSELLIDLGAKVDRLSHEGSTSNVKTPLQLAKKLRKNKDNNDAINKKLEMIIRKLRNETVTTSISDHFGTTAALNYKYLVIQGGGIKGLAYLGALPVLEQLDHLKYLTHIAGTSAGAITALLLSLNFSCERIEKALIDLSIQNLLGDQGNTAQMAKDKLKTWLREVEQNLRDAKFKKKGVGVFQATVGALGQLPQLFQLLNITLSTLQDVGLSDGQALKNWLENLISQKMQHDLDGKGYSKEFVKNCSSNLTFGRLSELVSGNLGYKDLYVFATDITAKKVVSFNSKDKYWQDVNVIEAVCASAALPIVFKPRAIQIPSVQDAQKTETHYFIDGGLIRNRPVEFFDEMSFQNPNIDQRWRYQQRTNRQTLALCLESGEAISAEALADDLQNSTLTKGDLSWPKLIWQMGQIFYQAENLIQQMRHDIKNRSIIIHVGNLQTTDFDVINDEQRLEEIKALGENAAVKFFNPTSSRFTSMPSAAAALAEMSKRGDSIYANSQVRKSNNQSNLRPIDQEEISGLNGKQEETANVPKY